ncbi:MAG: peptidoglycan editing factor PgeF [Gammaproteobacteria bacterium]
MTDSWLAADWDAPHRVRAGTTTRLGGVSRPPFDSLNLAQHVDDDPEAVRQNRRQLRQMCSLPAEPLWLTQTHSSHIIEADAAESVAADAAWTRSAGIVCAVLTADCVPLLLCDRAGTRIAAVHVGWRGLSAGIVENALDCLRPSEHSLLAWLGPHICAEHYEVGGEVRDACLERFPGSDAAFRCNTRGRWQCSLATLVSGLLEQHGIAVTASGHCSFGEPDRFYSYRRQKNTGRMASLIWMDNTSI